MISLTDLNGPVITQIRGKGQARLPEFDKKSPLPQSG